MSMSEQRDARVVERWPGTRVPTEIGRLLWFERNDGVADDLISTVDIAEHFDDAAIADVDLQGELPCAVGISVNRSTYAAR